MDWLTLLGFSWVVLSALIVIKALPRLWRWLRSYWYLMKLPRPEGGHWFFGDGIRMAPENAVAAQEEMFRLSEGKFPVVRASLGPFLSLAVVNSPDTIAAILRTSEPKNPYIYGFMRPWIGDGLLVSSGRKWARNRRLLTPAFHFEILRGFAEIYQSSSMTLIELWKQKLLESPAKTARVNVSRDIKLFTLDVLLQCAFSCESGCQQCSTPYTEAVMELIEHVYGRGLNVLLHSDFIYYMLPSGRRFRRLCDEVHTFAERIINQRREAILTEQEAHGNDDSGSSAVQADGKKHTDFLDILLKAQDAEGCGLSPEEIRDEVDTFLFEGHDTTASALQWVIYYLAKHHDVQQRCRDEVSTVISDSTVLTLEIIQQLQYISQVVKETFRMATTVPFIYRQLTKDLTVDGYKLTDGSWIAVSLWGMHHHPNYWPDPDRFDPSRFDADSTDRGTNTPFAFVPFSGGPRNCIGQGLAMEELKAAVALLVREYQLSLPADMEDVERHLYLVTRPSKPIEVLVSRIADE